VVNFRLRLAVGVDVATFFETTFLFAEGDCRYPCRLLASSTWCPARVVDSFPDRLGSRRKQWGFLTVAW